MRENIRHTQQELRRGRIATSIVFFTLGSMGGAWLARIPDVRENLGLNEGVLGTILLVGAIGGLASMQLAPHLMRWFGHRKILGVLAVLHPLTLLALPFAYDAVTLSLALAFTGGVGGLVGVLVNTHAVDVELAYERAIMSSFHAMFSVGSLVGAGIAGLLAGLDFSVLQSIGLAAGLHLLLVGASISWLLKVAHADPKTVDQSIDHLAHHHHRKAWWKGVILLGSLTFVAYMAEGAIADWSAIFLRDERSASTAVAVAGFVAFSACMTLGRFMGDWLTMIFGKVALVRAGALLAATGLLFAVFVHSLYATIVGFALVGYGLSILVPVLFSIAGNMSGGESHAAIARVSTIAYFGLLVGPAFIGYIAHSVNLVYALVVPAALLVYVGVGASLLPHVIKKSVRTTTL